jgi:hypothetical protein
MKHSIVRKGSTVGKRKTRPTYKPKIRWELLGLSDPDLAEPTTSIDTIRKEVLSLASRGFGSDIRSRSIAQGVQGRGRNRQTAGQRVRRRGAAE